MKNVCVALIAIFAMSLMVESADATGFARLRAQRVQAVHNARVRAFRNVQRVQKVRVVEQPVVVQKQIVEKVRVVEQPVVQRIEVVERVVHPRVEFIEVPNHGAFDRVRAFQFNRGARLSIGNGNFNLRIR